MNWDCAGAGAAGREKTCDIVANAHIHRQFHRGRVCLHSRGDAAGHCARCACSRPTSPRRPIRRCRRRPRCAWCWCAPPARAMPPTTRRSAGVLAQAQHYVLAHASRGARAARTTVVFDAAALERDITRGGPHRLAAASARCCWSCSRAGPPRVPSRPAARSKARSMPPAIAAASPSRVARPEALSLPTTGDIPAGCGARGRAAPAAPTASSWVTATPSPTAVPWRWTLNAPGVSETWNGTLEEGVHGAADVFARNARGVCGAARSSPSSWKSKACPTLKEYARVAEMLAEAPRRAQRAARRSGRHRAPPSRC